MKRYVFWEISCFSLKNRLFTPCLHHAYFLGNLAFLRLFQPCSHANNTKDGLFMRSCAKNRNVTPKCELFHQITPQMRIKQEKYPRNLITPHENHHPIWVILDLNKILARKAFQDQSKINSFQRPVFFFN